MSKWRRETQDAILGEWSERHAQELRMLRTQMLLQQGAVGAAVIGRFLKRWRKRAVHKALVQWGDVVQQHHDGAEAGQHLGRMLLIALQRIRHKSLAIAYLRWATTVAYLRAHDGANARAVQQLEAAALAASGFRATLVKGIVRGWQQRQATRGFRQWRDATHTCAAAERRLARAVARLRNGLLSAAWRAWVEHVRQQNLGRLQQAHERQLLQLQSEMGSVGAQQLSRFAARWRMRGLAQAWRAWLLVLDQGEAETRLIRLVLISLQRMCHRQLAMAMARWALVTRQALQLEAAGQRAHTHRAALVKGIVRSWQHRSKSTAWHSWLHFARREHVVRLQAAHEQQLQQLVVARVIARCKHKLLSSSWQSWVHHVLQANFSKLQDAHDLEMLELQNQMEGTGASQLSRFAARWRTRGLAQAWNAWVGCVHHAAACKRLARLMSATVRRWCKHQLTRGLLCWVSAAQAIGQLEAAALAASGFRATLVKGIVRGWQQRQATRGFRQWRDATHTCAAAERRLARAVARLRNGLLSAAWRAWVEHVRQQNLGRLQQAHERQLLQLQSEMGSVGAQQLSRFAARWRMRGLAQAFAAWACVFDDAASKTHGARRFTLAALRMRRRKLAMSLLRWAASTREARQQDAFALQADEHQATRVKGLVRGWQLRQLARSTRQWREVVRQARHTKRCMERSVARFKHRLVSMVWCAWWDRVRASVLEDMEKAHDTQLQQLQAARGVVGAGILSRCAVRWRRGAMAQALSAWTNHLVNAHAALRLVRMISRAGRRGHLCLPPLPPR